MGDHSEQIRHNLHRFQQPEAFLPFDNPTFGNPAWLDATYRVLIVRLSAFGDVDRSTPHLFLFQEIRRALPGAWIDFAFFPPPAERSFFGQAGIPYLVGTQSMHAAADFDLLLISNAYTLELINLPYLLLHSDIPLWSSERGPEHPLLILGGSNALATQSILRPNGDALVDALYFGEGEGAVGELAYALARQPRQARKAALTDLAMRITGLWAAGTTAQVEKAIMSQPQAKLLLTEAPLLNTPAVREASLQINYGCPAFCSFCFEGYERKPYRELSLPDLLDAAHLIKRAQGVEDLNLSSMNVNTHADLLTLLLELERRFDRVSLKSQRVDLLQHAEGLLEAEFTVDKRSFTLGIEGISEQQRAWLHKSLPTSDIDALLARLFDQRAKEIKLFYLLTGNETDEDIAEFRQWIKSIKDRARGKRVIFSFGLLIRMPFTPLRYDRLRLDEAEWKPIIGQVKSACETNGLEFRLAFDWPTYCVSQVLALGGDWLSEVVIDLARQGYCFDGALSPAYWPKFQAWLEQIGHWNGEFLGEKPADYPFSLSFVQNGISSTFLYRQFLACQDGQDGGYCLGFDRDGSEGEGHCLGCGACQDDEQRQAITGHRMGRPERFEYLAQLRQVLDAKRRLKPIYVRLRLPASLAHTTPEFRDALVFKELLGMFPGWIDNLLAVRESLFTVRPNERAFPSMHGETVFALKAWDTRAIIDAMQKGGAGTDLFEIVGQEENFTPGVYRSLTLDIRLPLQHFAAPRERLEAYLRSEYLPYGLRRDNARAGVSASYQFEVPVKGRKKNLLLDGAFETDEQAFHATLTVGPRFDLMAFLNTFDMRGAHLYADICVLRVE